MAQQTHWDSIWDLLETGVALLLSLAGLVGLGCVFAVARRNDWRGMSTGSSTIEFAYIAFSLIGLAGAINAGLRWRRRKRSPGFIALFPVLIAIIGLVAWRTMESTKLVYPYEAKPSEISVSPSRSQGLGQ